MGQVTNTPKWTDGFNRFVLRETEPNADLEKIKDIAPKLYNMLITLSNIE